MYEYIDIIKFSILMMILYIVYCNWKTVKNLKNTDKLFIVLSLFIYNLVEILKYNFNDIDLIKYNKYILISILILNLLFNKKLHKRIYSVLFINEILIFVTLFNSMNNSYRNFKDMIVFFIFSSTLCIYAILMNKYKVKNIYKIVCLVCFTYVGVFLTYKIDNIYFYQVGQLIEVIAYLIIFAFVQNKYLGDVENKINHQEEEIFKLNEDIGLLEKCLESNHNISNTIKTNIDKKVNLLSNILYENNKCVFLVDEFGYISNKDKSFSKIWSQYKNINREINIYAFVDSNLYNKSDFFSCIEVVNKESKDIEKEFKGKDERYFYFKFTSLSINEDAVGILCSVEDITYKKVSALKIRENDIKYKSIVDNIPYSILLTDENDIIYNNKATINMEKKKLDEIIFNDDIKGEVNISSNDNSEIHTIVSRASFYDGEGKKKVIAIRDITEYKNILKKVSLSKEKYQSLVDIIPEGIYTLDFQKDIITYANPSLKTIIGNEIEKSMDDELKKKLMVLTSVDSEEIEFRREVITNKNNEIIDIESGCMVIDVGKKLKVIGIVRDIREQVKAEAIELEIENKKADQKIKSEFFINVSHELKTPLNVISSSNQLLEILYSKEIELFPKGELSNNVKLINKYSHIMMGLINNIIDLAKLEFNIEDSEYEYYNSVYLVEDIVEEMNDYVNQKNIFIVFDTDSEEMILKLDAHHMDKMIMTILSMVVKYSEINSTIYVTMSEINKNMVEIGIKNNNGYNYSKYINDKYRRSTDIGISIVKQLVNMYKGKFNMTIGADNDIDIKIILNLETNVYSYNNRKINKSDNAIYYQYHSMYN